MLSGCLGFQGPRDREIIREEIEDIIGNPPAEEPSENEEPVDDEPSEEPSEPEEETPPTPDPKVDPWIAWNGDKQPGPTGTLGTGIFKTPYYIRNSGLPGPLVVITGGVHGNEPAGSLAAWNFVTVTPKRGTLIIIPEINRPGLKENERSGAYPGDPNRAYPQSSTGRPKDDLAEEIWNLVKEKRPDWLVDLHEGYDFHKINKDSVGQSIILYPGTSSQLKVREPIVLKMIQEANKTVSSSNHYFSYLKYPVSGSLARATGQFLGAATMIIETSTKQTRSLRIRQHEVMVNTLLSHLGMR